MRILLSSPHNGASSLIARHHRETLLGATAAAAAGRTVASPLPAEENDLPLTIQSGQHEGQSSV